MHRDVPVAYRIPLLIAGFVSLTFGIGTGLVRLGWNFPLPAAGLAAYHGPLMVCGFLGTVIALERAPDWRPARHPALPQRRRRAQRAGAGAVRAWHGGGGDPRQTANLSIQPFFNLAK